jgi:acetylornithine deacetylase/succinyl-diaminopimelate desuccinylase-like protein
MHRTFPRIAALAACLCLSVAAARAAPALKAEAAQAEALQFLQDLIRLDTEDPPGNETRVAEYLQATLRKDGIDSEILELLPGRASLVARLKGDGTKKPLLLMGHEDVVPVDRAYWTVDPFAGTVRDGAVWGRGASDDKGSVAANLEVFLQLKRLKVPLKRDVIFLAEASEEAFSEAGMAVLVERYWDKIACEFALNEGGISLIDDGRIEYLGVQTSEKLPRPLRLEATGTSGHGSVPRLDNAIVHLAAAVAKAGTWESPAHLNETTEEFFRRLATISPPAEAEVYQHVLEAGSEAQLRIKQPSYYSMLRTSVVPTMLQGGIKENVIPPIAQGTLDVRALPGEDMPLFVKLLAQVINDPQVKIVAEDTSRSMPAAPASGLHTAMFEALEAAQKEIVPAAITLPMMGTGATDSAFLRAKGVSAYGIGVPKTDAELRGIHGNDEHIEVASLGTFVRYEFRAVSLVAAK